MKTKVTFKKGDAVSFINEDKDTIVSIKRRNKDGGFDEEIITFLYVGFGTVEEVNSKHIKINEFSFAKKGFRTVTVPPSKVSAFFTSSIKEADKELNKILSLNDRRFKKLKQKIDENINILR